MTKHVRYMSFTDTLNLVFCLLFSTFIFCQVSLKGRVIDHSSKEGIKGVKLSIEGRSENELSDEFGIFNLECSCKGELIISMDHIEYVSIKKVFEAKNTDHVIDIGLIEMNRENMNISVEEPWLELSDEEIAEVDNEVQSIAGVLNAGKDLFSRTTAYDFGPNFFKRRFLGTEHSTVMLNGISMENEFTGRPEWSNWGGLNDALRLQERYENMESSSFGLGGLSQGTNMISLASKQGKSIKVSLGAANRTYRYRLMATFSSGINKTGWAYTLSGSIRSGNEGYRAGTNYSAYSFLLSIDKLFGPGQSINATLIGAYNKRGLSSPLTQEVFDLKSSNYNAYWGYQQGKKRNTREKVVFEPIFQLNYKNWINDNTLIHGHFTYQSGRVTSSRLDYSGMSYVSNSLSFIGGGSNPDPAYYQKLPSYFLRDALNPDYGGAFLAERAFLEQGQISWSELYAANLNSGNNYSVYTLYDDSNDRRFWSANIGISKELNKSFSIDGSIAVERNFSEHYAFMKDLLGGEAYLDIDPFSETIDQAQNNLREPNRIVSKGERFRYNYHLRSNSGTCFVRLSHRSKKSDAVLGMSYEIKKFQRNGLYENGHYPGSGSFGKSDMISLHLPGIKFGYTYKLNGRHSLVFNSNYLSRAPALINSFSNIRVSNALVKDLGPHKIMGFDFKHIWRHRRFKSMISAYFLDLKEDTKVSFYYADGLTWENSTGSGAFVQQSLSGIDSRNLGVELSVEIPVLQGLKLKGVAAIGRSFYSSNPDIYISSNSFQEVLDLGKSRLKGYFTANGPQNAFSIGFEYSSPQYWWLGGSLNFFDNSFIGIAPITRSKNFLIDRDGLPIYNIDEALVGKLLSQRKLDAYINLNIVGGKSWKLNNMYIGFFASINNLTNSIYKTGGFEQSRNANYYSLMEDDERSSPLFGPKYWFSAGTGFFTSIYLRL